MRSYQGGRGHWAVYTSPQNFVITFFIPRLYNSGDFYCQTLQQLIVSYRRVNFVCHHFGCTEIYRPLSYPLDHWILLWCISVKTFDY